MIPTPPFVVDGVERGSARNRRFALRSEQEVRDYLRRRMDLVVLILSKCDLSWDFFGILVEIFLFEQHKWKT